MEEINIYDIAKNIKMYPVISSNIVAIGYDIDSKILKVIFKNNSSYIYTNVEENMWNLLCNSESKGKFLTENITRNKERYKYYKV